MRSTIKPKRGVKMTTIARFATIIAIAMFFQIPPTIAADMTAGFILGNDLVFFKPSAGSIERCGKHLFFVDIPEEKHILFLFGKRLAPTSIHVSLQEFMTRVRINQNIAVPMVVLFTERGDVEDFIVWMNREHYEESVCLPTRE